MVLLEQLRVLVLELRYYVFVEQESSDGRVEVGEVSVEASLLDDIPDHIFELFFEIISKPQIKV